MGTYIVNIIFAFFAIIILFQPSLNDASEDTGDMLKDYIEFANEKAAVEGYYTPEIQTELKENIKKLGYTDSQIELTVTNTTKFRGEYVKGTVKVPNRWSSIMLSALFGSQERYHIKSAIRMSEYTP
jgi:hypothetical protein